MQNGIEDIDCSTSFYITTITEQAAEIERLKVELEQLRITFNTPSSSLSQQKQPSIAIANGSRNLQILRQQKQLYNIEHIPQLSGIPSFLPEGLNFVSVPPDGHCLYNAVALYFNEDVSFLRNIVAINLEHNINEYRQFIALLPGRTIEDYIQDIRTTNEWGGDLEITILSRLLDRTIITIGPNGKITNRQVLDERRNGEPIFVYYNNINHYDGMVLQGRHTAREILGNLLQETQSEMRGYARPQLSSAPTVDPQHLAKFLKHVGFGEQDETEIMLKANPSLAELSGDLIDCADRYFEKITGFQYAIWALDFHMWTMLTKYIPKINLCTQAQESGHGMWLKDYGKHVSWQKLINAYNDYILNYKNWTKEQRKSHWCQQVGGAQLILPAHVIQEYFRPDRAFYPCPKFNEAQLPRISLEALAKIIGVDYAYVSGSRHKKGGYMKSPDPINGVGHPKRDRTAVKALLNIRLQQHAELMLKIFSEEIYELPKITTNISDTNFTQITKIQTDNKEHSIVSASQASYSTEIFSDTQQNINEFQDTKTVNKEIVQLHKNLISVELPVNPIDLFLKHIVFGCQDKAEIMLMQDPNLATIAGNVTDCAGRKFTQITAFQYVVWALDWHMCNVLKKYLPQKALEEQIQGLQQGVWVDEYGAQVSWQNLIDALQNYIDNYNSWTTLECQTVWSQQIGGEQLLLPAHIIQEYCRSDQQFGQYPNFNEILVPRIDITIHKSWFENNKGEKLGNAFARIRGYSTNKDGKHRSIPVHVVSVNSPSYLHWINAIKYDIKALTRLLHVRLQQHANLISNISYDSIESASQLLPTPSNKQQNINEPPELQGGLGIFFKMHPEMYPGLSRTILPDKQPIKPLLFSSTKKTQLASGVTHDNASEKDLSKKKWFLKLSGDN